MAVTPCRMVSADAGAGGAAPGLVQQPGDLREGPGLSATPAAMADPLPPFGPPWAGGTIAGPGASGEAPMSLINPGFRGRRSRQPGGGLIPPGQHLVDGFPVLSAGPTPHTPLSAWDFTIEDEAGTTLARWTWDELRALPVATPTVDIHCVTSWSKLATSWEGVSVETLLEGVDTDAAFVTAFCDGGYT